MDRDGSRAATGQGPPAAAAGPTPSRPPPSPGIEALAAGDSVSLATSCDPPLSYPFRSRLFLLASYANNQMPGGFASLVDSPFITPV